MSTKRKTFYKLLVILSVIVLVSNFFCSKTSKINEKYTFDYEVVGFSYDPPAYKRYAERYVFVKNELGSFTFTVTPKTYYDIENGRKNLSFSHSYVSLVNSSDNHSTANNVKSYFISNKFLDENDIDFRNFYDIMMVFGYISSVVFGIFVLAAMGCWNEDLSSDKKEYLKSIDKTIGTIIYILLITSIFV